MAKTKQNSERKRASGLNEVGSGPNEARSGKRVENAGAQVRSNRLPLTPPADGWRDDNGENLRVTVVLLKEGVYPYDDLGRGPELIPADEFTAEALQTLEGRPVIVDEHSWRNADNTTSDGLTRGSVAGAPYRKNDELLCDLLIQDRETIEQIKDGKLVEVSASYLAEIAAAPGQWQGKPYECVQRNLRFNHILLCPPGAGRLGPNVRIINKIATPATHGQAQDQAVPVIKPKQGKENMNQNPNSEKEQDMEKEQAPKKAAPPANPAENSPESSAEIARLQAEIKDLKARLEKALSLETVRANAEELLKQKEILDSLLTGESDAAKRAELDEAIKNSRTIPEQRAAAVRHVMRENSVDAAGWSPERIDGAWDALRLRMAGERAVNERVANGGPQGERCDNSNQTGLERMMSVYRR